MRIQMAVASALVAFAAVQAPRRPCCSSRSPDGRYFRPSNWWNQDISAAPVDARSDQLIDWISGRLGGQARPPFAGSIRTSGRRHTAFPTSSSPADQPRVPVTFGYADESDTGIPGLPGYPIPDEARTTANYIEGGQAGRRLVGDRHLLVIDRDRWLLYETFATTLERDGRPLGCGLRGDLRSGEQRPPSRRLDVGRRRRPRDFSRAGALRRGGGAAEITPRVPRHHPRHQRLRLAGLASRRHHRRRATARRAAAAESRQEHLDVHAGRAADLPRDEAVRPDRRRQRLRHVHQRHDGRALEQRRAQSGVPRR